MWDFETVLGLLGTILSLLGDLLGPFETCCNFFGPFLTFYFFDCLEPFETFQNTYGLCGTLWNPLDSFATSFKERLKHFSEGFIRPLWRYKNKDLLEYRLSFYSRFFFVCNFEDQTGGAYFLLDWSQKSESTLTFLMWHILYPAYLLHIITALTF